MCRKCFNSYKKYFEFHQTIKQKLTKAIEVLELSPVLHCHYHLQVGLRKVGHYLGQHENRMTPVMRILKLRLVGATQKKNLCSAVACMYRSELGIRIQGHSYSLLAGKNGKSYCSKEQENCSTGGIERPYH